MPRRFPIGSVVPSYGAMAEVSSRAAEHGHRVGDSMTMLEPAPGGPAPPLTTLQVVEEGERREKALRREVEQVGAGARAAAVLCMLSLQSPGAGMPREGPSAWCASCAHTPAALTLSSRPPLPLSPALQLLSDLRRQQREAADTQELAAAREARLRQELAQLSEASLGCRLPSACKCWPG